MSDETRADTGRPPLLAAETLHAQVERAAAASAGGVPHALLALHVERLPEVGELCGPDAEAALVALVAATLDELVGPHLGACRVEGAAFALVKPRCLPRDAETVARRVRTALGAGRFEWHGRAFRLGASVGVLELGGDFACGAEAVARAVEACETAGRLGADGVLRASSSAAARATVARDEAWREHLARVI